ncbi:MAG: cytochrome c [Gemmataceae bacterium]|nr:cytochrome c [Gemmataceae bacterium]
MNVLFRAQASRQVVVRAALMFVAVIGLAGCDQMMNDRYSLDMRYPPRSDPVFKEATISGEELQYPDRPGQLPILSLANAEDPENPLFKPAKAGMLLAPSKANAEARKNLNESLEKVFGTPARPKVAPDSELAGTLQAELQLDERTLRRGSRLYRIQCLHCHGLSGDGRGPTAFWVNPHPRDYRQGVFKFTSVTLQQSAQKPRREDLLRTLRQGIDGTSMPSFGTMTEDELQAIVSYVIHLSMRGEVEYQVLVELTQNPSLAKPETSVDEWIAGLARYWLDAQKPENEIIPEPYPFALHPETDAEKVAIRDAVRRGATFFADAQVGCVTCHTDYGRNAKFRYDVWGTLTKPADLTTGIYRGGRRPIDLYYRMHSGINGSGMAAFKDAAVKSGKVKSLWDIVKFVEILPYPAMRNEYGIHID